jgi:hypothetical protein
VTTAAAPGGEAAEAEAGSTSASVAATAAAHAAGRLKSLGITPNLSSFRFQTSFVPLGDNVVREWPHMAAANNHIWLRLQVNPRKILI